MDITQLFDEVRAEAEVYAADAADYRMKRDTAVEEINEAVNAYAVPKLKEYADMLMSLVKRLGFAWEGSVEVCCDDYDCARVHITDYFGDNKSVPVCINDILRVYLTGVHSIFPDMSHQCKLGVPQKEHMLPSYYKLIVLEKCQPILAALDTAMATLLSKYSSQIVKTHASLSEKLSALADVLSRHEDSTKVSEDGTVELWLDGKKYVGKVEAAE